MNPKYYKDRSGYGLGKKKKKLLEIRPDQTSENKYNSEKFKIESDRQSLQ